MKGLNKVQECERYLATAGHGVSDATDCVGDKMTEAFTANTANVADYVEANTTAVADCAGPAAAVDLRVSAYAEHGAMGSEFGPEMTNLVRKLTVQDRPLVAASNAGSLVQGCTAVESQFSEVQGLFNPTPQQIQVSHSLQRADKDNKKQQVASTGVHITDTVLAEPGGEAVANSADTGRKASSSNRGLNSSVTQVQKQIVKVTTGLEAAYKKVPSNKPLPPKQNSTKQWVLNVFKTSKPEAPLVEVRRSKQVDTYAKSLHTTGLLAGTEVCNKFSVLEDIESMEELKRKKTTSAIQMPILQNSEMGRNTSLHLNKDKERSIKGLAPEEQGSRMVSSTQVKQNLTKELTQQDKQTSLTDKIAKDSQHNRNETEMSNVKFEPVVLKIITTKESDIAKYKSWIAQRKTAENKEHTLQLR